MVKFYMHAGSLNHGCEAIVRSTTAMLESDKPVLYTEHPEEDERVKLGEICKIVKQGGTKGWNPSFVALKLLEKVVGSVPKFKYLYSGILKSANKGDFFLSIGGDNYCYGMNPNLMYLNDTLNQMGAKTALWGCSVEPEILKDNKIIEDMKKYDFITARESITYNALLNAGVKENVYLYPDPAFTLSLEETKLPDIFSGAGVVGINVSPLVQKSADEDNLIYKNYKNLIEFILNQTDMNIALIPHVCKTGNDDRDSMKKIMEVFGKSGRIKMVNEEGTMNCCQLKYIISKCRFLVAARTHASIAAYSTQVPTLVLGYSVKALGIAKDLFGSYEHYVDDIRKIKAEDTLQKDFQWLMDHETEIRNRMESIMPEYVERAFSAKELINKRIHFNAEVEN